MRASTSTEGAAAFVRSVEQAKLLPPRTISARVVRNLQRLAADPTTTPDRLYTYAQAEGITLPPQAQIGQMAADATNMPGQSIGAPSQAMTLGMESLQGLTLGGFDEILTLISEDKGQAYRQMLAAGREQNAGTALLGNLLGGGALGAVTGGGSLTAGLVKQMGAGAGLGAVAGSLEAQPGQRGMGAATGAVVGGAVPPVMRAVGTTIKAVGSRIAPTVTPIINRILRNPPGEDVPHRMADRLIAQDLVADGATLDDLIARAKQMAAQGRTPTLGDLAGANTTALGEYAMTTPGPGAQAVAAGLEQRNVDAVSRIVRGLEEGFNVRAQDAYDAGQKLLATRRAAAAPLYQEAYQASVTLGDEFLETLKIPEFRRAYAEGRRLALLEGRSLPPSIQEATETAAEGVTRPIPVEALDYLKRGMDDLIEKGMRGGKMSRNRARLLRERLNPLLDEIDNQVPAYRQARAQFASDSQALEALEEGQNFLKKPAAMIRDEMASLRDVASREMYRVGAIQAVYDLLGKNKARMADYAKQVFGGTENAVIRQQLRALFPDQASYETFRDGMLTELRFVETARSRLGSPTAARLAKQEQVAETMGGGAEALARATTGGIRSVAADATMKVVRGARTGWIEEVNQALADRFTLGLSNPDELIAYLTMLKRLEPRAQAGQRVRGLIERAVAPVAAGRVSDAMF